MSAAAQTQPAGAARPLYRADPCSATLLIEVAHSSLRRDRTLKRRIYAAAGVAEYWIVDLRNNVVIVHRDPVGGAYATVSRHDRGALRPLHHRALRVDVAELLD